MELCPEGLWQELCRADPTCTFYQTPAWHAVAARHYGARSAPLLFRQGGSAACLPLLRRRRWGRETYFSPFGTYTALVCPERLPAEALSEIEKNLSRLNLHLISSPFTQNVLRPGKPLTARVQVIDLTALDPAHPMRDWDEGQRRRVRVAQREGLRVRAADSQADWDAYFELYLLSLRRWGGKTRVAYPKALFEDLRRTLSGNPAMRLWLAEREGKAGAGYLTFYHNRHVVPWHGAADEAFFSFGGTQFLFLTLIEDALRRGFGVFDLTGSGGLSGVEAFKSRFGTKTVEFESFVHRAGVWGRLAGLLGR